MSHCPLCDESPDQAELTRHAQEVCSHCGHEFSQTAELLAEFRRRAAQRLRVSPELITAQTSLHDFPVDHLGLVEFVTEIERDYQVNLLEQAWSEEITYGDVVRMILRRRPAVVPSEGLCPPNATHRTQLTERGSPNDSTR